MRKIQTDETCIQKFRPDLERAMYKTSIDVIGKHISGILLIRRNDSSTRIVFTNEMGFEFFDLGFKGDSQFQVYQITPQMNKKGLIKTLRKDFELLLFMHMDNGKAFGLFDGSLIYHAFPQSSGINYYITDSLCRQLIKMQRASETKPVMEAFLINDTVSRVPDSIFIRHLNLKFNFTISLKKIIPLAAE